MKFLCRFLYIMLLWPAASLYAQPLLKGIILDKSTGQSVDYGLILNYSKKIHIYSNKAGEFSMNADPGDTLVFSAVGYYYRKVILSDSLVGSNTPIKFNISKQPYEIGEARIYAMGTYDEFKQRFIRLDKPKTQAEVLAENLAEISRREGQEAYTEAHDRQKLDGITLLSVPIRSPEEKERIALARIMQEEKKKDLIYQKFNPRIVKNVTGLTGDSDIIEFMVFCGFSEEFLLETNEYDLMEAIAQKYAAYKKRHPAHSGDFPSGPDPFNRNS